MKCPELKAKSAAVVSPRAPSAFGGSKLKLKYSKFVFKISKLSTLLYYYVSLNWMLCDGCLGIIWVVSMSLSKCITSSFARQEGSDIAAIKKSSQTCPCRVSLKEPFSKYKNTYEEFPFPLLLTEVIIMFQCAQVDSVLDSSSTQIPLLSLVTKIQFENIFIDVHRPNPITLCGLLAQVQGYMAFLWVWINEVNAEPDFEDIPDSFLRAAITFGKSEMTSLLMKADTSH